MRVSVPALGRRQHPTIHVRTLHARVKLLTAGLVAIAVIASATSVYVVFNAYLQGNVDRQLERTAEAIVDTVNFGGVTPVLGLTAGADTAVIQAVGLVTTDGALVTATPGLPPFSTSSDAIKSIANSASGPTIATLDAYRVLVSPSVAGQTLIVAQSLGPTRSVLKRLAVVLAALGAAGIALAYAAGDAVARTGLRPISRLTAATQRVAATDDLTPIPVTGDDELASLTVSFNRMLGTLSESRTRQRGLITEAGQDLLAPLTALRTNIELLMSMDSASGSVSEMEVGILRDEISNQMMELTVLVGELVDRARVDESASGRIDSPL
ncbi:HAMP domain-containing protein [Rhodococcus sp. IEGM 1379]|uniref:HAMP domain-containing protein n=1 Tax=Rhodococcus sp. IEGM 1379 TaxID=3047086 RepID=UPI0024B6D862|nr:HAMP domain-containing protein [Rhodococcus sp. IEGM 1379]MDI9913681.1 HAMP domain-containing protein [Rhodococcus sp. IEGM 1379]